jgi:MFS family permease
MGALGQLRNRTNPVRLYLGIEVAMSFGAALGYTTAIVYRVRAGHLNPLDLILLGTVLEIAYFVVQLPTGVLADAVSRRLCVIAGTLLTAAGFVMQGLSPHFAISALAQLPVGFGAAPGPVLRPGGGRVPHRRCRPAVVRAAHHWLDGRQNSAGDQGDGLVGG